MNSSSNNIDNSNNQSPSVGIGSEHWLLWQLRPLSKITDVTPMLHVLGSKNLQKSVLNKHTNKSSFMDTLFASTVPEDEPSSFTNLSTLRLDTHGIALAIALLDNRFIANQKLGHRSGALADAEQCLRFDYTSHLGYRRKVISLRDIWNFSEASDVAFSDLDEYLLHVRLEDPVHVLYYVLLGQ